jgi:hypothetical protein
VVPELSERLDAAIRAALRPEPKERPRSCLEFFKLLTARPRFDDGTADDLPPSAAVAAAPALERRAWVRHPVGVGAYGLIDTCVCGGGQESEEIWPLVIRDLSAGGVGVLLARRFELGTELTIELPAELSATPRRLSTRVVRVVPEKGGHWLHGCAFPTKLSTNELATLLKFV